MAYYPEYLATLRNGTHANKTNTSKLQCFTLVQFHCLDSDAMSAFLSMAELDEGKNFEALCDALSRNDPKKTNVRGFEFPKSYGQRLGAALLGNQHVSRISILLDGVLQQDEVGTESANSLLAYIRGGTALRELLLYATSNVHERVVRVFVEAAASSPCLQVLHMRLILMPSDTLVHLLQTSKSVLNLSLTLDLVGTSVLEADVATALGGNTAIEHLELHIESNNILLEAILRSLGSHPSLKVLGLHGSFTDEYGGPLDGVAALLAETANLHTLELSRFIFDEEGGNCFLQGLQANRSLAKLSLLKVNFSVKAQMSFVRFFQTASTRNESTLRELCFSLGERNDDAAFGSIGENVCAMLSCHNDSDAVPGSTRGTLIEAVHLDLWKHENFIEALGANAAAIKLPSLCLSRLKHFEACTSAIPKLVHLRELDFENVNINHVNDAMATLKASVRKKGSLHVLNPPLEILIVLRVHETLIRVLQAFLSRNKMLPKLLAEPQSPSSCEANEQQTTHVPVFPTLFVAALPAERFALHNVLTGLLSASEDIGY